MFDGRYTCGGGHFWEDVFFYQKWRIQRNYTNKNCRLLDNWDICRFEGSFDECRKAFIKYIEAFELPRQKGHMIIMLHGLGESKNIFKPLWRAALKEGFMAAAINYPSTQKEIDGHVRQLDFFLTHLEDVNTISFVTKGSSNILLQKLFAKERIWQKNLRIERIVEVNPCVAGSSLLVKISNNPILGFIAGPMAKELDPDNVERIANPISDVDIGVVLSESRFIGTCEHLSGTKMLPVSNEYVCKKENACDLVEFAPHWGNVFKNEKLCNAVINFLKNGKF